ncbi:hypothetical protein ACWIGI_36420 [Nocardia sp. NPDC055321]
MDFVSGRVIQQLLPHGEAATTASEGASIRWHSSSLEHPAGGASVSGLANDIARVAYLISTRDRWSARGFEGMLVRVVGHVQRAAALARHQVAVGSQRGKTVVQDVVGGLGIAIPGPARTR